MRDFLTKNIGLKIFSLLFAVLLEVYFHSPENSLTTSFDVSIELANLPPSWMVVQPIGAAKGIFVQVKVSGPIPLVKSLNSHVHRILLSVPHPIPERPWIATFDKSMIELPSGVRLIEIQPASLELAFEPILRKELDIAVITEGKPDTGYRVEDLSVFPARVFAQGPRSELSGLGSVETEVVSVSNLRGNKRLEVPLKDVGRLTSLGLNMVSVEVSVLPIPGEKVFPSVPIKVLAAPGFAATAETSKATITLAGPLSILDQLNPELIADCRDLGEGRHKIGLSSELPKGVTLESTLPQVVTVIVVSKHG